MTRRVRPRGIAALSLSLLVGSPLALAVIADLDSLARSYAEAKARLPADAGSRAAAVREKLDPILAQIAALGTPSSVRHLERELSDPLSEVAVAAGKALLVSPRPEAVAALLRGMRRSGGWSLAGRVEIFDALAGSGKQEALDYVLRLARRGEGESRTLAIRSLARAPESDAALEAVAEGLRSPAYETRNAALRALEAFRKKAVVAHLIDAIEREKNEKLRLDSLELLVKITGYNMGFVGADWRKWWELAEGSFEFGRKEGGATSVVAHDLRYFGIEVTSKRLAFLVDASNSMLGPGTAEARKTGERRPPVGSRKIDVLKVELVSLLRKLPEETLVNIVSFDRTFHSWKRELHALAGPGRDEAVRFVDNLSCRGGTNIYDTLELALGDRRVEVIYLLSDGQPVGGKFTRPEDILREIGAINRLRGARIHTISFGRENDFLRRLAAESGGTYRALGAPERRPGSKKAPSRKAPARE